jgi:hypothetical protein
MSAGLPKNRSVFAAAAPAGWIPEQRLALATFASGDGLAHKHDLSPAPPHPLTVDRHTRPVRAGVSRRSLECRT